MECQSNLCDLPFKVSLFIFKVKAVHFFYSTFKLMLNIEFKLCNLTDWILFIMVMFLPVVVGFFFNIKLNRVITSCYSSYIKVNVFVRLNTFDVVEVYNNKEVHEHAYWSNHNSYKLFKNQVFRISNTCILNIKESVSLAFRVNSCTLLVEFKFAWSCITYLITYFIQMDGASLFFKSTSFFVKILITVYHLHSYEVFIYLCTAISKRYMYFTFFSRCIRVNFF